MVVMQQVLVEIWQLSLQLHYQVAIEGYLIGTKFKG